jgi:predicted nuclease of predicted toxin-antitoxin system
VRVLLDECVDWRLARDLSGHDVKTAQQMGWTGITNGELLALASQHFDVVVTVDRNLSFQQNLGVLTIAVVVIQARSNRLADLEALVPNLVAAIASAQPGHAEFIGTPWKGPMGDDGERSVANLLPVRRRPCP